MQYNNFTIIIFHKGSDPRRILNLKSVLFFSISLHLLHEKIYLKQGYHKNNHIVEKFIKLSKEQILKNAKLKGKKYESSTRNNF